MLQRFHAERNTPTLLVRRRLNARETRTLTRARAKAVVDINA